MKKEYKYEKFISQYYNITSKLVDENVEKGLGDKVAIYYKDKTYTYREMQQLINRVGNALHILGVIFPRKSGHSSMCLSSFILHRSIIVNT
jgi:acyl-coenzyme A synthetase/AMP-(fatty) acid ligase